MLVQRAVLSLCMITMCFLIMTWRRAAARQHVVGNTGNCAPAAPHAHSASSTAAGGRGVHQIMRLIDNHNRAIQAHTQRLARLLLPSRVCFNSVSYGVSKA